MPARAHDLSGLLAGAVTWPVGLGRFARRVTTRVLSASRGSGTLAAMETEGSYEVQISLQRDDLHHCVEFPHPFRPGSIALVALRDEALATWRELFPGEDDPDEVAVCVSYCSGDDAARDRVSDVLSVE